MSRAALLACVQAFVGKSVLQCFDDIKSIADLHRYSVLILDPDSPMSINTDESRLNVRTDKDGNVVSFRIG